MKIGINQYKKIIREKHLERERKILSSKGFSLKKGKIADPVVIWQGKISSPNLKKDYGIEIHYGENYPFQYPKIFPTSKRIKDNRHQNPSPKNSSKPGDICMFQSSISDWVVGVDCNEIFERAIDWFYKFENGLLEQEPAPPEIEQYYPVENFNLTPQVILAESLISFSPDEFWGKFAWLPTKSKRFAYLATLREGEEKRIIDELSRLMSEAIPDEFSDSEKLSEGYWYMIGDEPFDNLPRSVPALIQLISNKTKIPEKTLIEVYEQKEPKYLALCYESRFDNVHWLVYEFPIDFSKKKTGFRPRSRHKAILMGNSNNLVKIHLTHHLSKKSIFRRVSNNDNKYLGDRKILLLGVGTLGSRTGDLLVKAGIGKIFIIDKDFMKVGNVSRHVLGLDQLGKPKANGLKEHFLKTNPFLEVDASTHDIRSDDAVVWLEQAFSEVDLVISCIGNDATEYLINFIAMQRHKDILFSRVYAHATLGELFLATPNKLCFSCLSRLLERNPDIPHPPKLSFEDTVRFDDADCGAAFIPGSAVDIDFVALHTANIAIDYLTGKISELNYWLLRGREFDAGWDIDARIKEPYLIHDFSLTTDEQCMICSDKVTL